MANDCNNILRNWMNLLKFIYNFSHSWNLIIILMVMKYSKLRESTARQISVNEFIHRHKLNCWVWHPYFWKVGKKTLVSYTTWMCLCFRDSVCNIQNFNQWVGGRMGCDRVGGIQWIFAPKSPMGLLCTWVNVLASNLFPIV